MMMIDARWVVRGVRGNMMVVVMYGMHGRRFESREDGEDHNGGEIDVID